MYEMGVHHLDTARFLLGDIDSISSHFSTVNQNMKGEDMILVLLKMKQGSTVLIDGNRWTENQSISNGEAITFGTLTIEGTLGSINLDMKGRIEICLNGKKSFYHEYHIPRVGYGGDSCRATQQHFIDCILSGEEFETSGTKYMNTFSAVMSCYKSNKEKKYVEIEK